MRSERTIALGLAAIGYPLVIIGAIVTGDSRPVGVFTLGLAGLWWADELAWAATWPWRWWWGITREDIEAYREHEETTP